MNFASRELPRSHSLAQPARRFQQLSRHLVALLHTGLLGQARQQIVVDVACQAGRFSSKDT